MLEMPQPIWKLILMPSLVTLAVTLLRLLGEMRGWSEILFRRSAGGLGAVVGITWLAVVFAIYLALKLEKDRDVFNSPTRAILLAILALAMTFAGLNVIYFGYPTPKPETQMIGGGIVIAALFVMRASWPSYWRVMMAYAVAARLPVIVVMYYAIKGDWGTHYDVAAPEVTFTDLYTKFVQIGLIPQVFLWIPFTVILCGLFGIVTIAIRQRRTS